MRFHHSALFPFRHHPAAAPVAPATMPAPEVTVGTPRYNAEDGTFEARVDVIRDGATFRYPARVPAPRDADPAWVTQALIRHALGQSDTPRLH